MVDSWSPREHVRHYAYEAIHKALHGQPWQNRQYDVLDFGSEWFGDPDGGWQTNMRWMFKKILGPNLNHTLGVFPRYNVESMPDVPDGHFDVVVGDQLLEHVQRPWLAAEEIYRVLKPGGLAIIATPGMYPIHPSPLDCWRIMPDGYRVLFPEGHGKWQTITEGMWGHADRVAFEFSDPNYLSGGPTFTVDEAMTQPTFRDGNDGKSPIQIWWIGRRL